MKKILAYLLVVVATLALRAQVPEEFAMSELDEPPRAKRQVAPVYPFGLRAAGLEGRVTVEFIVAPDGKVVDAFIERSNNPGFERPALDAVMKWTFSPGKKNGRAVFTRCQIDIPFTLQGGGSQMWSVSQKPKNAAALPPALRWDIAPEPVNTMFPVFPFEEALKGTSGKVKVSFVVGPDGHVLLAKAVEAATPEFSRAALAAIDAWEFKPARKTDGTLCGAALAIEYEFNLRSGDVQVSESAQDILRQLRKHPDAKFAALKELDALPKPLSRRPPVYPSALRAAGKDGEALIEFFIDEQGDAQLPRIVSATAPEFGYAAAQAVATWRFKRPQRSGKPTIVRAQIPMKFSLREGEQEPAETP